MDEAQAKMKALREQNNLLLRASALGLLDDIKALVDMGADLDCQAKGKASPLHFAAAGGHVDIIEFMTARGIDPDAEDGSALHAAALAGRLEAVEALIAKGALVDISDGGDDTPLSLACRHDATDVAKRLLRAGGRLDTVNTEGLTPLGEALVNNCVETAEALLDAGAALTPARGFSLCHLVAGLGHTDALKLLLRKGADPNDQSNPAGLSALHAAVLGGNPEAVEVLLKWAKGDKKRSALFNSATRGGRTPLDCADAMIAEPEGADGGADAALVAERVRAALVKAGCKTAKAAGIAPAPKSTAEADDSLAGRFAALSEAEQRKRVQRWVDGSDADAVGFGLDGKALEHIRAARTLRLEAELEDVTAGMLDNDDWQALMRDPKLRKVVEDVQADPAAINKWGDSAEATEALGELRKLQAFCKPRGLKTNIARLVRTAEVTADVSRARAARNRSSAANAMEAARMALLSLAKGVPEAPSPKPAAAAAATTAAVAPKPAAAAAAAAKPAAAAASAVAAAKPAAAVATPKPAATAATREPVETPQRPSASAPQSDSVKNMEAGKKVDGAGESSPSQPAAPPPAERSAKDVAKDAGKAAKAVAAAKKKWEREEAERIAEEEMPMVHDEGWPTMRAFLKEVFSKQLLIRVLLLVATLVFFEYNHLLKFRTDSFLGRYLNSRFYLGDEDDHRGNAGEMGGGGGPDDEASVGQIFDIEL